MAMSQNRNRLIMGLIVLVALIAAGAFFGGEAMVDAMGGDNEQPITGPALQQASDAALQHLGEGRVTDTEVGDEEGYYEVEVTLDDGSQVDVHLDENFAVLGHIDDEEETEDANE